MSGRDLKLSDCRASKTFISAYCEFDCHKSDEQTGHCICEKLDENKVPQFVNMIHKVNDSTRGKTLQDSNIFKKCLNGQLEDKNHIECSVAKSNQLIEANCTIYSYEEKESRFHDTKIEETGDIIGFFSEQNKNKSSIFDFLLTENQPNSESTGNYTRKRDRKPKKIPKQNNSTDAMYKVPNTTQSSDFFGNSNLLPTNNQNIESSRNSAQVFGIALAICFLLVIFGFICYKLITKIKSKRTKREDTIELLPLTV